MGRRKKSIAEKEVAGNPNRRPLPAVVKPSDIGRLPAVPPRGLCNSARAHWRSVRMLGEHLREEDMHAVVSLCVTFARLTQFYKILQSDFRNSSHAAGGGCVTKGSHGKRLNPLLPHVLDLEKEYRQQLNNLGLTPRSRIDLNLTRGVGLDAPPDAEFS